MSFRRLSRNSESRVSFEKSSGHERVAVYHRPPVGKRWYVGHLEREGSAWVLRSRYRERFSDRHPNLQAAKAAIRRHFA